MSDTVGVIGAKSILAELGLATDADGDVVHGTATVVEEICAPGTGVARTSVLGTWSDILTGAVAGKAIDPRIPLTLDLEVQVVRPLAAGTEVRIESTAVKVGRSVVIAEARFHDALDGQLAALSLVSFIASPNPAHVWPNGFPNLGHLGGRRLAMPLEERFGTTVAAPGTVEVPHRGDGLNASGAIQGGLVAFGMEEALLSALDEPAYVDSLVVRYLKPSLGPARAEAELLGDRAIVRLSDAETGRPAAIATAHWTPVSAVA